MNSNYRSAVCAALFLVSCGCGVPAALAADDTPLSFQFSETLRVRDQKTVVDKMNGSLTEHVSSEGGNVRIDAAVPFTGEPALDPSTPIVVTAGNFALRSTLGADPHYRVGMHQANILLTTPSGSGKSSVVYGHIKVKWTRTRLTVQVEGNIPQLTPVCARDFMTSTSNVSATQTQHDTHPERGEGLLQGARTTTAAGDNKGETRAHLEVGEIRATARVVFHVKASARTTDGGHYVDSGIEWKYLNASPGEMDGGSHTTRETTVKVTGSDGA